MTTSTWVSSLALNVAGALLAATMCTQPAFSKEPRFPQLAEDQLTEEQKLFLQRFAKAEQAMGPSPDRLTAGPFNAMIRSPELGQRMLDLGIDYLNKKTSVPPRLNEFALLIVAAEWRAPFIWYIHSVKAAENGVAPDTLATLKANKRPANMTQDEAVVYDFVTELTIKKKISDQTYARAKKIFSDQQIVDLTVCAGHYAMIAMLQLMAEVNVPPGEENPFD